MSLQPWIKEGTVPSGLKATEKFLVGNRVIRLHSVAISNETRPLPDPRPVWVQQLRSGATSGVIFVFGHCSGNNDLIRTFPQDFVFGSGDTIEFSVNGENGDVYKCKLLYSVVKLG